jgi:hypothetical protein
MNWGYRIVVGMVIFMLFIAYLSYRMINTKVDLVADNYYESGQAYQDRIQKLNNTEKIINQIKFEFDKKTSTLSYDVTKLDSGTLSIYRPSDKKLDFNIPLSSASAQLDLSMIESGSWRVQANWYSQGLGYQYNMLIQK